MKSTREYMAERKKAAAMLEQFNQAACIHFAKLLRDNDGQKRICRELGIAPQDLIPADYFEAVYKILSFGPKADRAVLMLGTADEIEALVSKIQHAKGFTDETGHWIDL